MSYESNVAEEEVVWCMEGEALDKREVRMAWDEDGSKMGWD